MLSILLSFEQGGTSSKMIVVVCFLSFTEGVELNRELNATFLTIISNVSNLVGL